MKIVRNNLIPFEGFKAINLLGILFVRGDANMDEDALYHERVHTEQMKELLYVPFYMWYLIEWIVRLVQYRNAREAYRNISFEREAYANEDNFTYLETRKRFAFVKYMKV